MRFLSRPLHKLPSCSSSSSSATLFMASKQLLKSTFSNSLTITPCSHNRQLFNTYRILFSAFPSKPSSRTPPFCLNTNGCYTLSHANVPRTDVLENAEERRLVAMRRRLTQKLEELGMDIEICTPGQYNHLICPMCEGGDSEEMSLSLYISHDWSSALWMCFRGKCGWKGSTMASAGSRPSYETPQHITKVKNIREISVESLNLEPLCDELVGYFAERMITWETLQRNAVMQRSYGDQIAIAFTYWRNGTLVSCKYRNIDKKFWQEADTEKVFYGLDDIEETDDIIIVEGEMDKLAMEEAGFINCVSVPDGAPASVSKKDLPPEERDTKYQYLWNCKEYLKKASRIILATDGDTPGQALAEELARRLGRERCWRVRWPKKNDVEHFKDANEVLMYLGPDALKEVIEDAELYPIRGLFNFRDYFDEIDAYYHRTLGYEFGVPTGWRALDELYNVSVVLDCLSLFQ